MKILTYIIPKDVQSLGFIQSVAAQFEEKGKISPKQEAALRDIIGIEEDFFHWDYDPKGKEAEEQYNTLYAKLKRDRFRKTKNRNKCVRALTSIAEGKPRWDLINDALGLNFNYGRRW